MNPRVSVILPVRNGAAFLAEAIESVLSQTHPPAQVVVIDGRSEDRSAEIARSYAEVTYVLQDQPPDDGSIRGLPDAWNIGLDVADGDLIAFIGHDDRWRPRKLEAQIASLSGAPDSLGSITKFRFFVEPGSRPPPGFNHSLLDTDLVGKLLETLLARREAFDLVGPFRRDYAASQDVDWFLRARDQGVSLTLVDEVLLDKRIHDDNVTWDAPMINNSLLEVVGTSLKRRREGES